jgi:membrane associated rhomboid family serine protease
MKLWLPFLYSLALYGAFVAGSLQIRMRHFQTYSHSNIIKKTPWVTLIMATLISAGLVLQLVSPQLLTQSMRNTTLFLKGEWWRIITALFFQDGGWAGGISNIVSLLFIGMVAEQFWSRKIWLVIFFGGGVLSELVALSWQSGGAGNSVANLCLGASVAVACLKSCTNFKVRILSILSLAACIPLLIVKDIHGAALMIGCFIAIVITWLESIRQKNEKR